MEITDSCKRSSCFIRQKPVADTPEERVRQRLLKQMILKLGYPRSLMAVERAVGMRRFDIICYRPSMEPLLLIECKAEEEDALGQVMGYNMTVKAPFLCIAAGKSVATYWWQAGKMQSVPFLPRYEELMPGLV